MRESIAALALIRREENGRTLWLARWNPKWERYHFVSGHKHADESFFECVVRELGEELNLARETDFIVGPEDRTRVEFVAWSESAQEDTAYTMELFDVKLTGAGAREKIELDPWNRWLEEAEILSHQAADGNPVSETMERLLAEVGAGA